MRFSLINVLGRHDNGKVWGSWIQDHTGTLESAKKLAKDTELVNSSGNGIEVVIVEDIMSSCAHGKYFYYLEKLN